MTEKREPYEPYACMETGMAQQRALEAFRQFEDYTRNRQEASIRALWRVAGVQGVIIFLLVVFG